MARFKPEERSQGLFLEVNLYDQLVPGTFECTLDYLIDRRRGVSDTEITWCRLV